MMRKTYSFLLAALVGLLFVGCKEKPVTTPGDLEDPRIVMTNPNEVTAENPIMIMSSDSFYVDISFSDDIELRDWEITIRFQPALDYLRTSVQPWKETWFGDLDGKTGAVNFKEFVSFDPTAGVYEFMVKVTDMEGKSAMKKTYYRVRNQIDLVGPFITFMMPDTVAIDSYAIGNPIPIKATATDPSDFVKDIYLRVRDKLTKTLLVDSELRWDTLFQGSYIIDTTVGIPAGTIPGNYNIEIYSNDVTNNVGYGKCEIYIKPN
jgi:hypothetical protein